MIAPVPSEMADKRGFEVFYPTPTKLEKLFNDGLEKDPEFAQKVESIFNGRIEHWDRDTISTLLKSDRDQDSLTKLILQRSDFIKKQYPNFDPSDIETLHTQLDTVGDTLEAMDRWEQEIGEGGVLISDTQNEDIGQEQEKKPSVLRRALGSVGKFAKKHPIVTTLFVISLISAGVAAGFYYTGNWELLMTKLGLDKILGAADAADKLIYPTPPTPPMPGGGFIPPPNVPPGLGQAF